MVNVQTSIVLAETYNYDFLHQDVLDRSTVWSWIEDAYEDNATNSGMPPSIETMLVFMEHLFWEALFMRAWVRDDIHWGGTSLKEEINQFLEVDETATILDYIEQFYENGILDISSPGTSELAHMFFEEIRHLLQSNDVCFSVTQPAYEDIYEFQNLPQQPCAFKNVVVLQKPIKKVW